ncbi:MAG: glycosyltransferase [bacterium]|jgi:glycosyltransferase involved in cell wall biosynthesis
MNTIKSISIVSPFHNENKNLEILYQKFIDVLSILLTKYQFLEFIEIILIDDGSNDNSLEILINSIQNTPNINNLFSKIKIILIKLKRNLGQSYSLSTGFNISQGDIIITIDSDLQNDPYDIIKLFENLKNDQKIEVLSGYRKNRNEGFRVIASFFGNKLINLVSGYNIKDVGCSLKAYKKNSIKNLKLPYGYHRFLPIISFANKNNIKNIEVNFNNRIFGKSHYGYSRIIWLIFRLLTLNIIKGSNFNKIQKKLIYLKLINTFIILSIIINLFFKPLLNLLLIPSFLYILLSIKEIQNYLNFQNEYLLKNSEIIINSFLIDLIKKPEKIIINT